MRVLLLLCPDPLYTGVSTLCSSLSTAGNTTPQGVPLLHSSVLPVCTIIYTCLLLYTVCIDAYPDTDTVEQGTTLVLVCRVVGVSSTTVLSYQWTCPGGYCDAGAVDPEWAARIQQGNILVVNVRTHVSDTGDYSCAVVDGTNSQQVGTARYTLSIESECQGVT